MKINESKPAIIGVGAFMAASLGVRLITPPDEDATNLFVAESLDDIDVLAAEDEEEASCGEGQCGDDEDDEDAEEEEEEETTEE